jgi:ectoine hydroxylase-related dioxygenase (phytanoyl-CoA dioxygenase family)
MTTDQVSKHLRLLPGIPLFESPFFEAIYQSGYFSDWEQGIAQDLHRDGFAVFDFPDSDFNEKANEIIRTLAPYFEQALAGGNRFQGNLMPPRFQDAWEVCPQVKELAANAGVIALLSKLFGRQAFPFQSLNFRQGSQQHVHSDAVHFNSSPKGFMCGVWVALEDVTDDNGALVYHPGSHRWAIYDNEQTVGSPEDVVRPASQAAFHDLWNELIATHGSTRTEFRPKKGQALIWAANLLHGGAEIRDPYATRWSQVTHYFFENCAYYRPMASHPLPGHIAFIEARNIETGEAVASSYCHSPLSAEYVLECKQRNFANTMAPPLPDDFDPQQYLALNPDVAAAGADPTWHYTVHGRLEGRRYS